jgi:hypothetical protein
MIQKTILICAWILWMHYAGGWINLPDGMKMLPIPFLLMQAYETKAECEKAQGTSQLQKGYDRFVCLPDTIKPNSK